MPGIMRGPTPAGATRPSTYAPAGQDVYAAYGGGSHATNAQLAGPPAPAGYGGSYAGQAARPAGDIESAPATRPMQPMHVANGGAAHGDHHASANCPLPFAWMHHTVAARRGWQLINFAKCQCLRVTGHFVITNANDDDVNVRQPDMAMLPDAFNAT